MRLQPWLAATACALALPSVQADCTLVATAGNDTYRCDSGRSPALVDTSGDNSLLLPAAGTGIIDGGVTFGAGADRIEVASGTIDGTVDQGDGADTFTMSGGEVNGSVNQGNGIDEFRMSGGVIQGNVNQGDALDRFFMTGGWIQGTFDSGDYAEMDDGRIGNVNMRLDKNTFIMRGGAIDRNLITAFDRDYVEIFAGTIGGNISVSGGDDAVLLHGGRVGGDVLLSTGNDSFTWDGGTIGGRVDMGPGDDIALLRGLPGTTLVTPMEGGLGDDSLTFDSSQPGSGALYTGFEQVALRNSTLTLNDSLVLGDASSGNGSLDIDGNSVVRARNGAVLPFTVGQGVRVVNAGTLDLTGGNDAAGRLTIKGDYVGAGGTLRLNSVLAGDGAASDRLVVDGGSISGSTTLLVNNLGGAGAATPRNGILVVQAQNGATSTPGAFVQTQVLSAGAYDYRLFRGGVDAGTENSFYLRSSVVTPAPTPTPTPTPTPDPEPTPTPTPDPEPTPTPNPDPVPTPTPDPEPTPDPAPTPIPSPTPVPTPEPEPTPGTPSTEIPQAAPAPGQADLPVSVADSTAVPLYRPEVPVYAAAPRGAAIIARQALGTFHQRQGDQRLLRGEGGLPGAWGQAYGGNLKQQFTGTVSPQLDADLVGFNVGQDLWANVSDNGYRQHTGFYVSHSRLDGDVKGFALAEQHRAVGDLVLDGDSVGLYWTLVGPAGAYLDTVVQYTDLDGRARSDRGGKLDLDGHAWTGSIEVGYPLALGGVWTLEPQAQIIAQKTSLDTATDAISRVKHDAQVELTGRVGVRLQGDFESSAGLLQPYAQLNVWHGDGGRDTLIFDGVDRIKTDYRYTSVQAETGLVARIAPSLSVHGGVQYTTNVDARQQESSGVNVGVRWDF